MKRKITIHNQLECNKALHIIECWWDKFCNTDNWQGNNTMVCLIEAVEEWNDKYVELEYGNDRR